MQYRKGEKVRVRQETFGWIAGRVGTVTTDIPPEAEFVKVTIDGKVSTVRNTGLDKLYQITHDSKPLAKNGEPVGSPSAYGESAFTGTEDECFDQLHRIQPQSVWWATRYEGYKIELVPKEGEK